VNETILIICNSKTGNFSLRSSQKSSSIIVAAHFYFNQGNSNEHDLPRRFPYSNNERQIEGTIYYLKDVKHLELYINYLKDNHAVDPEVFGVLQKFAQEMRCKIEKQLEIQRQKIVDQFTGFNPAPCRAPDWIGAERAHITPQQRLDALLKHPRLNEVFTAERIGMTRAEFDAQINEWRDPKTHQLLNHPVSFDFKDGRKPFIIDSSTYEKMLQDTKKTLQSCHAESPSPFCQEQLVSVQGLRGKISDFLSAAEEAIHTLTLHETVHAQLLSM